MAIYVTWRAIQQGLPLVPETLLTAGGGQIAGLSKSAIRSILRPFGFYEAPATEAGRTSQSGIALMREYVAWLNDAHEKTPLDLTGILHWWIGQIRNTLRRHKLAPSYDCHVSLAANLERFLRLAARQMVGETKAARFNRALAALLGAVIEAKGCPIDARFLTGDARPKLDVSGTVIYVEVSPSISLVNECSETLAAGRRPVVFTVGEGVPTARSLLSDRGVSEGVEILDGIQFLTASVYEHSLFDAERCEGTFTELVQRYNEIVERVETDPALKITITKKAKA